MNSVLLTGHRGFIGSKLLLELQSKDNLKLYLLESDLRDLVSVKEEVSSLNDIDTLVFLVGGFNNSFKELFDLNVLTLSNCIESLIHKGLKNIVFVSSGAVYGDPINFKSSENDTLLPTSLYGLAKKYSEDLLRFYYSNKNLNIIILRFPNVYGQGNKKGVIFKFLDSIKNYKYVMLDGDGNEKRNFLNVNDAVKSIVLSIDKFKSLNLKKRPPLFEVINISDDVLYSLNDVLLLLKNIGLNFKIKKNKTLNQNSIKILSLNNQKMKEMFNWEPETDLKDGVSKILGAHKFLESNKS